MVLRGIGDGGPWAIHPQSNVAIAILLRGVGGPPWTAPQRLVTGRDVWTGWCSGAILGQLSSSALALPHWALGSGAHWSLPDYSEGEDEPDEAEPKEEMCRDTRRLPPPQLIVGARAARLRACRVQHLIPQPLSALRSLPGEEPHELRFVRCGRYLSTTCRRLSMSGAEEHDSFFTTNPISKFAEDERLRLL